MDLKHILFAEGRITVEAAGRLSQYTYNYNLTDHLGNTRVTFTQNGTISQEDSYYPFGMNIKSLSHITLADGDKNPYLYNSKEMQEDFGLNWYDYGARFYDAQLGRWHVVDPLAEERTWLSPYNYVQNNPISRIDPTGALDDTFIYDMDGNYVTTIEDDNDNEVVFMNKYLASSIKMLNNSLKGNNKALNKLGKDSRTIAYARYTQTTASEMKESWDMADNKLKWNEPGGMLYLEKKSNELHCWTTEGDGHNFSPLNLKDFPKENGTPFIIWHGHEQKKEGLGLYAAQPTSPEDFTSGHNFIKNNSYLNSFFGQGSPGMIATKNTVTLYRMYQGILKKPLRQQAYKIPVSSWPAYKYKNLNFIKEWSN